VARKTDPPVVLIKWYDFTKWLLERIDSFPKNQRFIFGQRLADLSLDVMELLVEAAYSPRKSDLLAAANRKIEMLRWLVRLAQDRNLLSGRQYEFCCQGLTECGRMVGGWWKQSSSKEASEDAPPQTPV
jgi:23S rRNA-intervening sequence protein